MICTTAPEAIKFWCTDLKQGGRPCGRFSNFRLRNLDEEEEGRLTVPTRSAGHCALFKSAQTYEEEIMTLELIGTLQGLSTVAGPLLSSDARKSKFALHLAHLDARSCWRG